MRHGPASTLFQPLPDVGVPALGLLDHPLQRGVLNLSVITDMPLRLGLPASCFCLALGLSKLCSALHAVAQWTSVHCGS
jgi:hypothetical protein